MYKLLAFFLFLNLLSPFSFAMEWEKPSKGKEEEEEEEKTSQPRFKKPKTPYEELSAFEKLPTEVHVEIIEKILNELISQLKEQERKFLETYKWPSQELVENDYDEQNIEFNAQTYQDLEHIYNFIKPLLSFRTNIKLISKTLDETRNFIKTKITKAICSLNINIKNGLLLLSIKANNAVLASLLLSCEANIDADLPDPKNLKNLISPYQEIFVDDSPLMLNLLIQKNIIKIHKEDLDDYVNTAAQYGALNILKYLIYQLKYSNFEELTKALIIACQDGQTEIVKFLLNYGVNAKVKTEVHITPEQDALPLIIKTSLIDGLQKMIDEDFYVRTNAEQTSKLKEIIALLKQYGAKY